jgi:hypothetical protein
MPCIAFSPILVAHLVHEHDTLFHALCVCLRLKWVSVDDTLSLWLPAPAPAPRPPPRVIHCKDYILAVGLVRTDPSKAYECQSVGPYLLVIALRECVQFYSLHQSESELVVLETGMEVRSPHDDDSNTLLCRVTLSSCVMTVLCLIFHKATKLRAGARRLAGVLHGMHG